MGLPCKDKSYIFTLFANFYHQSVHQVLHSTLMALCDTSQNETVEHFKSATSGYTLLKRWTQ